MGSKKVGNNIRLFLSRWRIFLRLRKGYSFTFKYNDYHLNENLTFDTAIKASFSDIADLKGTLYLVTDPNTLSFSNDTNTKTANAKIKTIGYATTAGGYALWTISGDKIDTSTKEAVVLDGNNLFTKTEQ